MISLVTLVVIHDVVVIYDVVVIHDVVVIYDVVVIHDVRTGDETGQNAAHNNAGQ